MAPLGVAWTLAAAEAWISLLLGEPCGALGAGHSWTPSQAQAATVLPLAQCALWLWSQL